MTGRACMHVCVCVCACHLELEDAALLGSYQPACQTSLRALHCVVCAPAQAARRFVHDTRRAVHGATVVGQTGRGGRHVACDLTRVYANLDCKQMK